MAWCFGDLLALVWRLASIIRIYQKHCELMVKGRSILMSFRDQQKQLFLSILFLISVLGVILVTEFLQVDRLFAQSSSSALERMPPHVARSSDEFIWRIGLDDLSGYEFGTGNVDRYTVPNAWESHDWKDFPRGLTGDAENQRVTDLSYRLETVPQYGVEFSLRVLEAKQLVPQLAVYANGSLVGMIQTWSPEHEPLQFRQTYRLYIPKEFLQAGDNTLRLALIDHPYGQNAQGLAVRWDYLGLSALRSPAAEPVHGRPVYMGSVLQAGDSNFSLNPAMVTHAPYLMKWLGIAYSGNILRATYWSDVQQMQPPELQQKLLETYRDLNLTVVADRLNTAQVTLERDGSLPPSAQQNLDDFFGRFGKLFQYYEIDNEPSLFKRSKAVNVAIAQYLNQTKPAHVRLVAPGWAYWPTGGTPDGWERDVEHRRDVEALTQVTNGHSYGQSYNDFHGGSFVENLKTFGNVVNNGFPREFLVTETGTNDHHAEAGASQPHAAEFDRILRAHVAVVDRFMQHAMFGGEYSLFKAIENWQAHDPRNLEVYPGVNGQEPRLQTFRRLALAYATHGKPLSYRLLNREQLRYKNVYFRAVDTSALKPLPGSGGTANKILLNFVNFEDTAQTLKVRVTLPQKRRYQGEAIGTGQTYGTAVRSVSLDAEPEVSLEVNLPPRESVQYILH
jgi:hypothetical protein